MTVVDGPCPLGECAARSTVDITPPSNWLIAASLKRGGLGGGVHVIDTDTGKPLAFSEEQRSISTASVFEINHEC